jgi:surface polysaccharide O-acyltransferase-like enzyme
MQSPRLHGLDNLRALVVFLVVTLHALISYMPYAPANWFASDGEQSFLFLFLCIVIDAPLMPVMFFLAGYFALPALERHGPRAFLADKTRRIVLPWLFGLVLLAPVNCYYSYWSRGLPMTYGEFWRTDYWGPAYGQSVYWFLGFLTLFFVALAAIGSVVRRPVRIVRPRWWGLAGFVAVVLLPSWLIGRSASLVEWDNFHHIFYYQSLRVPLYVGYFAFGVVADRHGWFTAGGYTPPRRRWIAAGAVSALIFLAGRILSEPLLPPAFAQSLQVVLLNLYSFVAVMAALAVFAPSRGEPAWFWRPQARTSYGVYYFHSLLLYPLVVWLRPFDLTVYVKMPLVVVATYLATAAFTYALTRFTLFRRVF